MLQQIRFLVRRRYLSLPATLLAMLCATASAQAATILLDFDSVDTSAPPGFVDATGYLASYGITLANVTAGTTVNIVNDNVVYGGTALIPPSPPNMLMQLGSNAPVSFTLQFSTPLDSFGFTVPGDEAPSAFPAWQAYAFAGTTEVDSTGQGITCCHGPLIFTLDGPGITSVRFDSQNQNFAAFSAVPLDDFVLTASSVPEPSTLLLLGSGLVALIGFGGKTLFREE